jgi:hypothetical protein
VTDFTWVDIEEHSWDTNDVVLNTLLKEAEAGEEEAHINRRKKSVNVE